MKIGNTDIPLIKLGNNDVVIYLGSTKIYPSSSSSSSGNIGGNPDIGGGSGSGYDSPD